MFKRFVTFAAIFMAGFALCALTFGGTIAPLAKETLSLPTAQAPQSPCTPQFWEYRVVSRDSNHKNLESDLNRLANQGFEVFSVKQSGEGSTAGFDLTILLRRPKQ